MSTGSPAEAVSAFENAIVAATKKAGSTTGGDPLVSSAFALGWQMAEIYRPPARGGPRADEEDLIGIGSLSKKERVSILVDQIQAALATLASSVVKAGLPPIDVSELVANRDADDRTRRPVLQRLHLAILGTLTAADFRLGKAYGLGRALADTCRKPTDQPTLQLELGAPRIANLLSWLDDLSSVFPPHAAHSVYASLSRWRAWAAQLGQTEMPTDTLRTVRRQGELWRALLSGEKRGTEMLEIDNYLDAAHGLAGQMRSVLRGVIVRFPILAALVVVLLGLGIWLIASGGSSDLVAGATALLAALGIGWKGLGGAIGQLAGRVEQPLWEAEISNAVAAAITLLPDNRGDHRGRRSVAIEMGAPKAVDEPASP